MSGEEKIKKNRSAMWNYFTKIDQNYARCSMCSKMCSYGSTVTNLRRHLERIHPDLDFKTVDVQYVEREAMPGGGNRKTSKVWDAFTQLDDGKAKCDICGLSFSYKSSTTNLAKHLYRKHKSYRYTSLGNDEDPREGLREFIALDGEEVAGAEEERDDADGQLRDGDTEWTAPPRKLRKSASSVANKRIKPEVISSNGVDYVIYTHEQPRASAPTLIPARPLVPSTPTRATPAPTPTVRPHTASTAAEDEFTTFAKFLSQRIRSFKEPYWQSCAINEINIALHKVEMRRYEPPRSVPTSVVSVQTENFGLPVISHVSTHDSHDVVEEIVSHVEERC